jgi:hypothetical protein
LGSDANPALKEALIRTLRIYVPTAAFRINASKFSVQRFIALAADVFRGSGIGDPVGSPASRSRSQFVLVRPIRESWSTFCRHMGAQSSRGPLHRNAVSTTQLFPRRRADSTQRSKVEKSGKRPLAQEANWETWSYRACDTGIPRKCGPNSFGGLAARAIRGR